MFVQRFQTEERMPRKKTQKTQTSSNDTHLTSASVMVNRSPLAQMEEERREHVMKMKKMEAEMEQVFEMKVKEKKQKLKDSEAEVSLRLCEWVRCLFYICIVITADSLT